MSDNKTIENRSSPQNRSFHFTIKWSVGLFLVFISIGFLFRLITPTELHLDSSLYIEKVFTQERIEAWNDSMQTEGPSGMFEPGSILYIIDFDDQWALVRPLRTSFLDSVWVQSNELFIYDEEIYKEWAREYERNIVRDIQGANGDTEL
jgi:hypothetical protein